MIDIPALLNEAQADPRLPKGTRLRDVSRMFDEFYSFDAVTEYTPAIWDDAPPFLRTPMSAYGDEKFVREVIAKMVDRHVEQWEFYVKHAGIRSVES